MSSKEPKKENYPAAGFLLPDSKLKPEIRKFHLLVRVKETARKCAKKCDASAKLLFCLLNLLLFDVLLAS